MNCCFFTLLGGSCVYDNESCDIILKLVNAGKESKSVAINLSAFNNILPCATKTELTGGPDAENSFENSQAVIPLTSQVKVSKKFDYTVSPMSLTVIRIKTK